MADVEPGLRLHYVTAGEGERTIVLLHGFPQTWWEWHKVIPGLVGGGLRVIAPDLRGAGHSWRPAGGYDKVTMAGDVQRLLREHLGVDGPVVVCGHDIGLMVAYAYAQAYRDEVSHLIVVDAPLPGTQVFDRLRSDPRVWHFAFHGARDVAEMLVAGRERQYCRRSSTRGCSTRRRSATRTWTSTSPPTRRRERCAPGSSSTAPSTGTPTDNRAALERNGKLTVPVLAVGGEISTSGALVEEMMREVAADVHGVRIPGTGHWVPEEKPEAFVRGGAGLRGRG